jgi:hypothetical protein
MAPDLVSLPVIFRLKPNRRIFVDVLVDGLTYIAMHQRDHTFFFDSENLRVACHSRHPHNTRLSSAAFELHLLVYGFSRVSQDIGLIVHRFNNKFGTAKMGRHLLRDLHALEDGAQSAPILL